MNKKELSWVEGRSQEVRHRSFEQVGESIEYKADWEDKRNSRQVFESN